MEILNTDGRCSWQRGKKKNKLSNCGTPRRQQMPPSLLSRRPVSVLSDGFKCLAVSGSAPRADPVLVLLPELSGSTDIISQTKLIKINILIENKQTSYRRSALWMFTFNHDRLCYLFLLFFFLLYLLKMALSSSSFTKEEKGWSLDEDKADEYWQ